jgi:hypothetical protein
LWRDLAFLAEIICQLKGVAAAGIGDNDNVQTAAAGKQECAGCGKQKASCGKPQPGVHASILALDGELVKRKLKVARFSTMPAAIH